MVSVFSKWGCLWLWNLYYLWEGICWQCLLSWPSLPGVLGLCYQSRKQPLLWVSSHSSEGFVKITKLHSHTHTHTLFLSPTLLCGKNQAILGNTKTFLIHPSLLLWTSKSWSLSGAQPCFCDSLPILWGRLDLIGGGASAFAILFLYNLVVAKNEVYETWI